VSWRWTLAALTILSACGEGEPSPPRASGAIVLELDEARASRDAIAARIATEVEVLKSGSLAMRVVQARDLDTTLGGPEQAVAKVRRATRASRRGESLVIDVGVDLEDPELARVVCNALIDQYLEQRMLTLMEPFDQQIRALAAASEILGASETADPSPEERERIAEQRRHADEELTALQTRMRAQRNDARALDPCTIRR
jgi:uncharacterized protein involved in exopolysaccharide biosynthesis